MPAHDEQRGIVANLASLLDGGLDPATLDVIVVCNGCTDRTADTVREAFSNVTVIELAEPSKVEAVRAGNAATDVFPRLHLDADVTLTGADLARLIEHLHQPGVLAVAPRRIVPREGCSPVVRWYYDVWERLPQVVDGLFGRGAFVLSRQGQARVDALPRALSDDLVMSDAFADAERMVVNTATVVVRPPRTVRDLVRRRIRIATGATQASELGVRRSDSATTPATLVRLARHDLTLIPRMGVFIAVTVVARHKARRFARAGDFSTWQRDESSRS